MTPEEINSIERYYFEKIKAAFEGNGMTFLKTICSAFPIKDTWENYENKKSCFQEALERCIQSTITNNFDWEICGTPVGADSVFVTPKAIIHIDAKCVLNSDNDAKNNCLSVGPNQTSYSDINVITKNDKEFKSNLPSVYKHEVYGELVCLTYFIKVCYDRKFDESFSKSLNLSLNCFPNGKLADVYGTDFLKIGKNNSARLEYVLPKNAYSRYIRKCDDAGKTAFRTCYKTYRGTVYYISENVRDDKDALKELERLFINSLIREDGDRSKKVNGKKYHIKDYWILYEAEMQFISTNYSEEEQEKILGYYDEYNNVALIDLNTKAEDKTKLKTAYKSIKLNTYANSIRIDFDKVTYALDKDSEYNWEHSQEIMLM